MVAENHAIEVTLDKDADEAIRRVWRALDEAGVASLGQGGDAYRPHLSLSVFGGGRLDELAEALRIVLGARPVPSLRLSHLGAFLSPRRVLFCGVAPSLELIECQREVDAAIRGAGGIPWPHYSPSSWVPHCTLAMDVDGALRRLEVLGELGLPLDAHAAAVRLVEVPSGREVAAL